MKNMLVWLSVVVAMLVGVMAGWAEGPKVVLQYIKEERYIKVDPAYMSTGHSVNTVFCIKVVGVNPKTTNCGNFVFTEAKDDLGTNLLKNELGTVPPPTMMKINGVNQADNSFVTSFYLLQGPRKANMIKTIKGEFTVVGGGEKKELVVAGIKGMVGKEIVDEGLKAAGIKLTVKESQIASYKDQAVVIVISGNREAITNMELQAKDGGRPTGPTSSSRDFKAENKTEEYFLWVQKMTEDMKVKISYVVGQEKVTVPIDMKDVKLP